MTGGYSELVELAELELELVHAGELERASELQSRWNAVVAGLPAVPPPEARPLLERAAALQVQTAAALERDMAQAASELHSVRRGRHAVQAYTPPPSANGTSHTVDSTG